jgi:hypothetical protein
MKRSQTQQAKRAIRAARVYGSGCAGCRDSGAYSWCEECQGDVETCYAPVERAGAACAVCVVLAVACLGLALGLIIAWAVERCM